MPSCLEPSGLHCANGNRPDEVTVIGVWLQSLGSNNVAQVLYFLAHKVAFSWLQFQPYLLEALDHQRMVLQMLSESG